MTFEITKLQLVNMCSHFSDCKKEAAAVLTNQYMSKEDKRKAEDNIKFADEMLCVLLKEDDD